MGEQKRRQTFTQKYGEFVKSTEFTPGKGARNIRVFRSSDLEFILAAMSGQAEAVRFFRLIADAIAQIHDPNQWNSKQPPLCIVCDATFGPGQPIPPAFIIQTPFNETQDCWALVSGACAKCAKMSDQDLMNWAGKRSNAGPAVDFGAA